MNNAVLVCIYITVVSIQNTQIENFIFISRHKRITILSQRSSIQFHGGLWFSVDKNLFSRNFFPVERFKTDHHNKNILKDIFKRTIVVISILVINHIKY